MTARLNPEAPRRGFALGPTWAPTCPPRPMLSRRKPAGQVAALRIPFFFFFPCSDRRENHPGDLGLAEAVKQTSAGGKDAGPRGGEAGSARAEPAPGRPAPGHRRLPFSSRPGRPRPPRQKEPRRSITARRPASPGLAHATLANDEDLQGGQHVLVHPDPARLQAQPPRSDSQFFPRESGSRMRAARRLPPFYTACLGCRSPGLPISALR